MALISDPLVSTQWLNDRLGDPQIRVIDATWWFAHEQRSARAEFDGVHIPGAVFFDIDAIADQSTALPHMLAEPQAFAEAVGALGIGDQSQIVVYEAEAPRSSARAWWTFRAMGHGSVHVLDGGLAKWRLEDRPIQSGSAEPKAARFTPRPDPNLCKSASDIRRIIASHEAQIVDARPRERFDGLAPEPRAGLARGHMPGAINVPAGSLYGPGGAMRSKDELTALLTRAGVDLSKPLISTCGSGITACTIALAAARLGRWDMGVYDGSWAEWGALSDAPVVASPPA